MDFWHRRRSRFRQPVVDDGLGRDAADPVQHGGDRTPALLTGRRGGARRFLSLVAFEFLSHRQQHDSDVAGVCVSLAHTRSGHRDSATLAGGLDSARDDGRHSCAAPLMGASVRMGAVGHHRLRPVPCRPHFRVRQRPVVPTQKEASRTVLRIQAPD